MHERLLTSDKLGLLLLGGPYVELFELLNDQVPVVLLGDGALLVFHRMQVWVKCKWFFGLFDDGAPDDMHDLTDVVGILDSLSVVPMEPHSLLLHLHFVALVVFDISSVDHPEVEVDV